MADETNTQTDPPPDDKGGEQTTADERDYEAEARKTGWRPEAEFHGATEKWIPAKDWVERGETFIPYLRNSQKELRRQLEDRDARMQDMDRRLKLANKALEELKETVDDQTVETMETDLATIEDQVVAAREAGDARQELKLTRQYNDLSAEIRAKKAGTVEGKGKKGVTEGTTTVESVNDTGQRQPSKDPVFEAWVEENQWFRDDPIMTGAAVAAMQQFNQDAEFRKLTPRERLDKVAEETKKRFNYGQNAKRGRPNKVEGARNDGGGGNEGKTYRNLPRDAQTECDSQAKRFVGRKDARGNIKYKTIDDYRASYAADYFADDWGQRQMNA